MKLNLLIATLLVLCVYTASTQGMPVIKATTTDVDIRDGLHFKKGYWHLTPEKKPDRYYAELPGKEHRVIFYTDMDSAVFDIAYGGVYNFIILLNNKDTCYTQIIAAPREALAFKSQRHSDDDIADTIPFTISKDNKMLIKASINHSDSLNFQFDLGSSYPSIRGASVSKVNVKLNSAENSNDTSGTKSQLGIAGLTWDSIRFYRNDEKIGSGSDGVVGNSLFQDKVVEINYDKKWIIVHDALPVMDTGYSRHEMILSDNVPMMQASLATKDTSCTTWFIFDTGNSGNSWIDDSTASRFQLYRGVNKIISWGDKVIVKIPELRVANLSFLNISAVLEKKGTHSKDVSFLGNSLLKRFNAVIDNHNGYIYLKPNSLKNAPYDNTLLYIYGGITLVVVVIIILLLILRSVLRKKRLRREVYTEPEFTTGNYA